MIIWEQADASPGKEPIPATYSWILDKPPREMRAGLTNRGWRRVDGGCLTTSDPEVAAVTAVACDIEVKSNGSHERLEVPGLLCVVKIPVRVPIQWSE